MQGPWLICQQAVGNHQRSRLASDRPGMQPHPGFAERARGDSPPSRCDKGIFRPRRPARLAPGGLAPTLPLIAHWDPSLSHASRSDESDSTKSHLTPRAALRENQRKAILWPSIPRNEHAQPSLLFRRSRAAARRLAGIRADAGSQDRNGRAIHRESARHAGTRGRPGQLCRILPG